MGRALRIRRSGGFLLVLCLMLTILLFVLGLSFLGKRAAQYRRVGQAALAAQAKSVCEAGVEDVLLKFQRDYSFPPMASDQTTFSYSEQIINGTERLGGYTVTIDGQYRAAPYLLYVITVVGEAGAQPANPSARRAMRLEIDCSPLERTDVDGDGEPDPNLSYRKVINFNDLGGF